MWNQPYSTTNTGIALKRIGLLLLLAVFAFSLVWSEVSWAAQSTNRTVNFQGRLRAANGDIVPNGSYNIQFKIYHGGSGNAAGNPDGALAWTETYANGTSSGGVQVVNGYFSVRLGSVNTFGSSVDWNHDTIWISMNVAGSSSECSSFGTSPCVADGEMLPMSRVSASPFAINSGALEGKTAANFVQLAQGVQTDASTNTSSIFINKTGTGNLVQLQSGGSDVFVVSQDGDLTLGSASNKSISVAVADPSTNGGSLAVIAGAGGSGSGSSGGTLTLQGGDAGGDNGDGGDIEIDAGAATGSGSGGTIAIGSTNASSIEIGSTSAAVDQTIVIGGNNTTGSNTDVIVGSGSDADGGTTVVRAKNAVAINTDGIDRATFVEDAGVVYFGNGVSSTTPDDFTLQGTNSSATAVAGGSLLVQGGNATAGDANGGNVVLSGGLGSGTGANGLVVLNTPAVSTVSNDTSCFTGGAPVSASCTISASSVNNAAAVVVGFSVADQTATLPDPANKTAGRIFYVSASNNSQDFALIINDGDENGAEKQITLRKNTTATLFWNGTDWTEVGSPGITTLQDAYNNSPKTNGSTEVVLNGAGDAGSGLTLRDNPESPSTNTLIDVQNANSSQIFSVNKKLVDDTEYASDGNVNDSLNFFDNWGAVGGATVQRIVSDGQESNDSIMVSTGTSVDEGASNLLASNPQPNASYLISVYAKLVSGSSFNDLKIQYSPDNGVTMIDCANYNTQVVSGEWAKISCSISTNATVADAPFVSFTQPTAPAVEREFLLDSFSFTLAPSNTPNVKVGGAGGDDFTIFTLDKSSSAPTVTDNEAMLGSMYYDTTLGKIQCYEASGWGNCSASPDIFVTISPEYPNAVMNGAIDGTMSSDLCSDTLNINSSICGTNETYNYYEWTSSELTNQTHSIYVTYKLPDSFKSFAPGTTSLVGRSEISSSSVNYQIYRDTGSGGVGLVACGEAVPIPASSQPAWSVGWANGSADPANCGFQPGESILFRINLTASEDASAYASNLEFVFSNN